LPPHSTIMCPILHHLCTVCKSRGHHERVHVSRSHTLRELRERFFQTAHKGALTAVPFLTLLKDLLPKLTRSQWRLGYRGTNYRADPVMRAFLGLDTRVVFSTQPKEVIEQERKIWVKGFAAKMERVRRNAEAKDLSEVEPINRDVIAKEIMNITEVENQARSQDADQNKKKKHHPVIANKLGRKNWIRKPQANKPRPHSKKN